MTPVKKLAIWMDHASAHIMEFNSETLETKLIESNFSHEEKEASLEKSENLMHNKEQHAHATYYKKLGEVIKNYGEVILFGPTDAKQELFNLLKADHHFHKIKIEVKPADKMTEAQQHIFANEHFSKT